MKNGRNKFWYEHQGFYLEEYIERTVEYVETLK